MELILARLKNLDLAVVAPRRACLENMEGPASSVACVLLVFGMDRTNVIDGGNKWPRRFGKIPRVPEPVPSEADLRALRLRYNAAYSAYQSCLMALNEAAMSGQPPSKQLLENEAKALRELTEARGDLLAAMATANRSS